MDLATIVRVERLPKKQMILEATRIIEALESKPKMTTSDRIEKFAIRHSWRSGSRTYMSKLMTAHRVYS